VRLSTFFLALPSALATLAAACGPVAQNGAHPMLDLPETAAPIAVLTASASASPPIEAPMQVRSHGEKNTSVVPSRFDRELSALGLDPKKLPPFASMTLDQKKGLMPLFAKSLGYAKAGDEGCSGCHVVGDYKVETRNRALSRQMYDRWSVGLEVFTPSLGVQPQKTVGVTLFCDSCHEAKPKVLDRSDTAALKTFMKAEYGDKLLRRDEQPTSCATCHGEDLEISIFDKLWKIKPEAAAAAPSPAAPGASKKPPISPQ
jgi:hypothetical protein